MSNAKTILIIEDETPLRLALTDTCVNAGLQVLQASDGETGLELALLKHPDMILLDLMLPGRDGMSVLTDLRKDAWGKHAKVIILSNVSDAARVAEALAHQTYKYLAKSDIEIDKVMEVIKTYLEPGAND